MKSSKINRLNFAHPWALVCLFAVLAPVIAVMCFALLPTARAECRDGCALYDNTYQGDNALANLALTQSTETSGINNTAVGSQALKNSTTARGNTAVGANALYNNTTGHQNIGIGIQALQSNTTGTENVAIGGFALTYNNGSENVAIGDSALGNNSTAGYNVAVGHQALVANTTGFGNTGIGHTVLVSNTTGNYNTAYGFAALWFGTGSSNIALGYQAGYNLTTGNNNIDIGALGVAADSGTIRIGTQGTHTATYIAGIAVSSVAGGAPVVVDANGHLGVKRSSARFKEAIKPMDKGSEAILALEPVTFRYKEEFDPDKIPQFGLIAEQVERVNQDLVMRDEDGKVSGVRYDAVNAMLLNEFLKARRELNEQEATIARHEKEFASKLAQQQKDFRSMIARQQKQIEALVAGLQKVSDRVELAIPGRQVAANRDY